MGSKYNLKGILTYILSYIYLVDIRDNTNATILLSADVCGYIVVTYKATHGDHDSMGFVPDK